MNNEEFLIEYLKDKVNYNFDYLSKEDNIRAMMNVAMPVGFSEEFYLRQDKYLQDRLKNLTVIDVNKLSYKDNIALFKGDITLLKADAIINAANSQLLGCFVPNHHCIDNAIHSFAGLQVRRDLIEIMAEQGHEEPNGQVKVTKGYNLPAKYIFHTVGPIYRGQNKDNIDLTNCYYSCLKKADEMKLESIVFCSISTWVFGFPIDKASQIAIKTVKNYLEKENQNIKMVIFDVFSDVDYKIYEDNLK